jgi:hypothetical protein
VTGLTDLEEMLRTLQPEVRAGEFVYVSVPAEQARSLPAEAVVREAEGTTVVLRRQDADAAGLPYDFVAGWITLSVHSALEAVGLTAAVAETLGQAGVSCNVLAGLHHDHLLVPVDRVDDAVQALRDLAARHRALGSP